MSPDIFMSVAKGGIGMRFQPGDVVNHPTDKRSGVVLDIRRNPACLMRHLVILWDDGSEEELEEIEFGPLED